MAPLVHGFDPPERFVAGSSTRDAISASETLVGVGLTVTAANHVVHLARWWNPAVEDQCTDRVNRIGQTREVHVYYPLAKHPTFGEQSFDLLLDQLLNAQQQHVQTERLGQVLVGTRLEAVQFVFLRNLGR